MIVVGYKLLAAPKGNMRTMVQPAGLEVTIEAEKKI